MRYAPSYKAFTAQNVRELAAQGRISGDQCFAMQVLGSVFPFKVSSYVVDELIDWQAVPSDPLFRLTFPHRDMLADHQFDTLAGLLRAAAPRETIKEAVAHIQKQLNPHPANQMEHNVPLVNGRRAMGMQHKYRETVLYFPSQGQTCHAYCTFCFRWAQFIGNSDLRFAAPDSSAVVAYLQKHPVVSDLLVTGGDPLVMSSALLMRHVEPILAAELPGLDSIRFGTKSLSYWPHRFTTDPDATEVLNLFRRIVASGRHCAIMAHVSHPRELSTPVTQEAIARIRDTGAEIRCQSPLLRHINDAPHIWVDLWRSQVRLGCAPYYMFVARDTGACEYFRVPLARVLQVFRSAYSMVGGLCRTVRGPTMSADPGKIRILGTTHIGNERVFVLEFLQARNPKWVGRPFFARFDPEATWWSDLRPAWGESHFFFETGATKAPTILDEEAGNSHRQLLSRGLRRTRSSDHQLERCPCMRTTNSHSMPQLVK